ncbi:hypothetical protein [Myceligenerans pegani]|uniref:Uncharacterized protein n=1 Tax=Myceligenerans pegani TaxID=2776917 RepID=A0ABR9MVH0_9MICO|nr:hypothetical protein [Myceligenerans sp. TRM 65318]MBE1875036.1 hypothetical protein [Myceligenerans sp. TRM 65318]MBE3017307.1 hypothetical protein [Myceligenerans sp. TRM 65318]
MVADERDALRELVAEARDAFRIVREERLAAERSASELPTLNAAIRITSREMDAATSPQVEALMEEILGLEAEAEGHRRAVEHIRELRRRMIESARPAGPSQWVGSYLAEKLDNALADAVMELELDVERRGSSRSGER